MRVRGQEYHPDTFEGDCHYFKDYQEAREMLWRFYADRGQGSYDSVDKNLNEALIMAHNLISKNWHDVEELAAALLSNPRPNRSEICAILTSSVAGSGVRTE